MADLDTILQTPISWKSAANDPDLRHFLQDLQANILKGHGRQHSGHIFLSFAGMAPEDVAGVVRTLALHCTSAYHQLLTNKRNPPHLDGGPVRCLFLTAGGYKALGLAPPAGAAFTAGMAAREAVLNDPPRGQWQETGWRDAVPDAMFLVADANDDAVTGDLEAMEGWLNGTGARILVVERGLQQTRTFNPALGPEGVEHFGYVDGRSQPLFLAEDLANELHNVWNAAFRPSQFIVADPHGSSGLSAGSYFVFRKLEQNVRGFNAAENALGRALYGPGADEDELDRAGAMVVGRFEDGTPLTLNDSSMGIAPPNDFNYDGDAAGAKCPFHAHIRKTNPRGDVKRQFGLPDDSGDRNPIMARRGITYGPKRPMKADNSDFADVDSHQEPEANSGLLFMAYMASIEAQFEFTQQSWADNKDFLTGNNGVDPVIGQTADAAARAHVYLDGWTSGAQPKTLSFGSFVTMKGGAYFFAPSLSFLRGVGM